MLFVGEDQGLVSPGGAEAFALALDEHGQAAADLAIVGNQKGTAGTGKPEFLILDTLRRRKNRPLAAVSNYLPLKNLC